MSASRSRTRSVFALVLTQALLFSSRATAADGVLELGKELLAALDRAASEKDAPLSHWDAVYDSAIRAHGDIEPLVAALRAKADAPDVQPTAKLAILRGLVHVQHRDGRLADALETAKEALALGKSDDLLLTKALLEDAADDADAAIETFRELEDTASDSALRTRARLRISLLSATRGDRKKNPGEKSASSGSGTSSADEAPSALYLLASDAGTDVEFQNRAALVLALLGRYKEAIELYHARPEGVERFKDEIRLAEWALAAGKNDEAKEYAWNARTAATLKRDRMYALTVLVEAYRKKDDLSGLIGRFAAEKDLDAESRRTWIDLLRETSRIDEALALFESARGANADAGFTPEMRRDLLEMCREAGREDKMVATYRELIDAEPERGEWREGLCRYLLEHGRRDEAESVLAGYVARFPDDRHALAAAETARDLGLDDFASKTAQRCLADSKTIDANGFASDTRLAARMFLFDFEVRRGRVENALAHLEAFDREADPKSPLRVELAESFERIGNKKRAADVLEKIRTVRGADGAEEDLEMRLAWLLSEIGDEKTALERWRNLWRRVDSLPRRRQVEDRLMAVASRLGVLADIAIDLEEKLADGKADDRDSDLLVRIYQKVNDPASAAEVTEEHMKKAGADEIATLNEKSRIFLAGKDYYHFEKTVKKLIEIDAENRGDHLRQLAMSNLERGRPKEAREVLSKLTAEGDSSDAAEFEAGVLSLSGLNDDAARTYRRGLVDHPERIDSFLLLANAMRAMGDGGRATGMFQYLAENADKDDLFTIAIDGVLNMRAPAPVLRSVLRITLERLAARHDRLYLYQLVSDLADELKDNEAKLRALESSLAIAGEQRSSILRELMDVAQGEASNSFTIVNGQMVQRRVGGDDARRLAYGRRLIGLPDIVPPQVYLELGQSFLAAGAIGNAAKTFAMARDVPDYAAFQRQVAQSFEGDQYVENALAVYERTMASQGVDVSLMLKTAQLNEQLGRDGAARELYQKGMQLLLSRHPLQAAGGKQKKDASADPFDWSARNIGEFEKYFGGLKAGFLATAKDDEVAALFDAERALFDADLAAWALEPASKEEGATLENAPRVMHRAALLRDLALRYGWIDRADAVDAALLRSFSKDTAALDVVVKARQQFGYVRSGRELVEGSGFSDEQKHHALAGTQDESSEQSLALSAAVRRLLPILVEGDREKASLLVRRALQSAVTKEDLPQLRLLFAAALFLEDKSSIVTVGRQIVRATVDLSDDFQETERMQSMLARARSALDDESFGLVVDAFVDAVNKKKGAFARYGYELPEMQRQVGHPLFTSEALKQRLEESLPDESYLIDRLVVLAPADERVELLQSIWSKVPPTARAEIALGLFDADKGALGQSLVDFAVGAFNEGIEKVDDPRMLTYRIRSLLDSDSVDPKSAVRIAEVAHKRFPANAMFTATVAAARIRQKDREAAKTALRETLTQLPAEQERFEAQEIGRLLVEAFVPGAKDDLIAELDRAEAENHGAKHLDDVRIAMYDKLGDTDGKIAALEKVLTKSPDDPDVLSQLYYAIQQRGDVGRRIEILEALAADKQRGTYWIESLRTVLLHLRDPARFLEWRDRREGGKQIAKPDPEAAGKKLEPANFAAVKSSIAKNDLARAANTWRRTWRQFGSYRDYGIQVIRFASGGSRALLWPDDDSTEDGEAADEVKESRGGLFDLRLDEPRASIRKSEDGQPGKSAKPKTGRTVYEAIAEYDFGLDALLRQIRSLEGNSIQASRELVRGLQRALLRAHGKGTVEEWLARVRDGRGGTLDQALLFAYYEDHIDSLSEQDRGILSELIPVVDAQDASQIRALAHLYARMGDADRASRLYQWCATLANSSSWFFGDATGVSSRDLLEDVRDVLSGERRLETIAAILRTCRPGPEAYDRDDFIGLTLRTWYEIVARKDLLSRCKDDLDRALDLRQGISRMGATAAVPILLYADGGDGKRALRALEIAICKLDEKDVEFSENERYSKEWRLRAPSIGNDALRGFFDRPVEDPAHPIDAAAEKEAWRSWLETAATQCLEWSAAGRLDSYSEMRLFAVLSVRLQEAGSAPGPGSISERVLAHVRDASSKGDRQLYLDLLRKNGDEATARKVEDELLASNGLEPVRVDEVIGRIEETEGKAVALERGVRAMAWTPHPKLLARLQRLATELSQDEVLAKVLARKKACEDAAKKLEHPW